MKSIAELMSKEVERVDVTWSALQVIALMNEKKIGSVIIEKDKKLLGIFTERDLLTRVDLTRPTGITSVGITDIMTPVVMTVDANQELVEVVKTMRAHNVRHLPVVDDGEIIGIVSSRDLLEHYEMYLEQTIAQTQDMFASTLRNSRSSQNHFRRVFGKAKIGVVVTDTNHRVTSWNRYAADILNRPDESLEEAAMDKFFGDQWEDQVKPNITLSVKNEHPYHFETTFHRDNAAPLEIALSVGSAKDESGKNLGTVYIIAPLDDKSSTNRP